MDELMLDVLRSSRLTYVLQGLPRTPNIGRIALQKPHGQQGQIGRKLKERYERYPDHFELPYIIFTLIRCPRLQVFAPQSGTFGSPSPYGLDPVLPMRLAEHSLAVLLENIRPEV